MSDTQKNSALIEASKIFLNRPITPDLFYSFPHSEKSTTENAVDTPEHRNRHVGKSNYSGMKVQPWDIWLDHQLNPWDADIVKRLLRTKAYSDMTEDESRIDDYEKIKHICEERIHQLKNGNPYYRERN